LGAQSLKDTLADSSEKSNVSLPYFFCLVFHTPDRTRDASGHVVLGKF
jgi:hypothetical protein